MSKSAPFNDIMAPGLQIGGFSFKSVERWLELLKLCPFGLKQSSYMGSQQG